MNVVAVHDKSKRWLLRLYNECGCDKRQNNNSHHCVKKVKNTVIFSNSPSKYEGNFCYQNGMKGHLKHACYET